MWYTLDKILGEGYSQLEEQAYPSLTCLKKVFKHPPQYFKVVLIGQDPYPSRADATGYCFDSPRMTSSLRNLLKQINPNKKLSEYDRFCNLEAEGVLLLNAIPTFSPLSSKVWKDFLDTVLSQLKNCIIGAIGNTARDRIPKQLRFTETTILAGHPSPLNRTNPIVGSGFFKKINQLLLKKAQSPVDWNVVFKGGDTNV